MKKTLALTTLLFAGTLLFAADAPRWTVFQSGKITAKNPLRVEGPAGETLKAVGSTCALTGFIPGEKAHVSFLARGKGTLEGMVWGKKMKRTNIRRLPLTSDWTEFRLDFAVPEDETALSLSVFFWDQQDVHFDLKDLVVKAK